MEGEGDNESVDLFDQFLEVDGQLVVGEEESQSLHVYLSVSVGHSKQGEARGTRDTLAVDVG